MDDGVWVKVEFRAGNHAGYWERIWVSKKDFATLFEPHAEGKNLDAEVEAMSIIDHFDLPSTLANDIFLTFKYKILR